MPQFTRVPAECFPPVDFIREELQERGWNESVIADRLGEKRAAEIMAGERISPRDAIGIGEVFGTGPIVWMNLQMSWKKWLERR